MCTDYNSLATLCIFFSIYPVYIYLYSFTMENLQRIRTKSIIIISRKRLQEENFKYKRKEETKQRINSVTFSFYHNELKQCSMITRKGKSPRKNQFFMVSNQPAAAAAMSSRTQAAWAMLVAAEVTSSRTWAS